MCFAPQRRALFRHRNFQKWSERAVFLAFSLANVLRATTACTFSTSQFPKVVPACGVLYILTWKRASRHNGVQFFISHLARWLRTRRFNEHTFRPSGATNHWKNKVFRDFPTFSRTCIFFLLTLSLLWSSLFFSSLFYSSLLSDSSHLCFSSVHIVGSLTSKLPSIDNIYISNSAIIIQYIYICNTHTYTYYIYIYIYLYLYLFIIGIYSQCSLQRPTTNRQESKCKWRVFSKRLLFVTWANRSDPPSSDLGYEQCVHAVQSPHISDYFQSRKLWLHPKISGYNSMLRRVQTRFLGRIETLPHHFSQKWQIQNSWYVYHNSPASA